MVVIYVITQRPRGVVAGVISITYFRLTDTGRHIGVIEYYFHLGANARSVDKAVGKDKILSFQRRKMSAAEASHAGGSDTSLGI
ncbi:jg19741 [Pararge aegeria aegeria]|uniref:Jg19741 protein n=1 Tax=Pararge aegeria aegeria TaxID=348720 RepID=A0A8S4RRH8_9NEOP|nr:jg19741 [Pararge aegeria aegeria]